MCTDDRRAQPDVTFAFGHDASAARAARRALEPLLTGADESADDEFAEDVRLVASELVTNVYLHTEIGGELVAWDDDPLRLEVRDEDPRLPTVRPDPSVNGGRGLSIVSGIADRWGAELCEHGKTLWAELRRPRRRGTC